MAVWIACCQEQEHAQSRVNGDDHFEVLGSPAVPGPPRRPQYSKRVDREYEYWADNAECERQELVAILLLARRENAFGQADMRRHWTPPILRSSCIGNPARTATH